jgi:WD40 repeat protein
VIGAHQPEPVAAAALALAALALAACSGTLPPLRGQIEVGAEGYAIVVAGDAADGDLYAVRASGGPVVPITFSRVGEMRPALSPDGRRVAFLRGRAVADSTPGSVWVMDLLTGGEREVELPRNAGIPQRVGWSMDGITLTVAAGAGLYRAKPAIGSLEAEPVPAADRPAAESTLAVLLGQPVFARVVPCAEPGALCVAGDTGSPGLLAEHARDAARWGPDSVAFLAGNSIEVRPLGSGRARRIEWSELPGRARELTAFAPVGR